MTEPRHGRACPGHDAERAEALHCKMNTYTRDEVETGRKLFNVDWQFAAAASSVESLPKMRGTEIAFAGRSNVGKSSLINALTSRKALARTSRTPGRTQELIFFNGGSDLNLVDMPGYGYAAAAKSKIAQWTNLIEKYLLGRANLARVYVLIDARHGLKDTDHPTFKVLGNAAVSYQVVLTKTDEVKAADLPARIAEVEAGMAKYPSAFPTVLATSSETGFGLQDMRSAVARLLAERKS